jgi:hypothetical protein
MNAILKGGKMVNAYFRQSGVYWLNTGNTSINHRRFLLVGVADSSLTPLN